jgi:pyruvate dehydrogenase E1 component beta subunit
MSRLGITEAIDKALEVAMADDDRIIVIGEDVPMMRAGLFARFGPERVREAPISEGAFLGAGVGAALGGLRPVIEIMFVDFLAVALHPLINEAAMVDTLSGGRWQAPLLVRAACGGGYGDAGQHEQSLWGMLGSIPGLAVAVPSTPADAAGLTLSAFDHFGPVVLLEHKLLSTFWLEMLAGRRRPGAELDIPESWLRGEVSDPPAPVPFGEAVIRREGSDLLIVSVAVGVHRALQATEFLAAEGIEATVLDLRTICPLDREQLTAQAAGKRGVLVVDEDYGPYGLSAEIAATLAEAGVEVPYARVTATGVIPYAPRLEAGQMPGVDRILAVARALLDRHARHRHDVVHDVAQSLVGLDERH